MSEIKVNATLDITNDICPITFVKTKLQLEEMQPGEILEVTLKKGEPLQNVPRSVKEDGHKVVQLLQLDADTYRLWIEKRED